MPGTLIAEDSIDVWDGIWYVEPAQGRVAQSAPKMCERTAEWVGDAAIFMKV